MGVVEAGVTGLALCGGASIVTPRAVDGGPFTRNSPGVGTRADTGAADPSRGIDCGRADSSGCERDRHLAAALGDLVGARNQSTRGGARRGPLLQKRPSSRSHSMVTIMACERNPTERIRSSFWGSRVRQVPVSASCPESTGPPLLPGVGARTGVRHRPTRVLGTAVLRPASVLASTPRPSGRRGPRRAHTRRRHRGSWRRRSYFALPARCRRRRRLAARGARGRQARRRRRSRPVLQHLPMALDEGVEVGVGNVSSIGRVHTTPSSSL